MNGLLTKTLYSLIARAFFKKKADEPLPAAPDPVPPARPGTGSHEGDSGRGESGTLVDADTVINQIQTCTRELQRSCKKVDKDFLGIGERLKTISDQAGELTRNASLTVQQMGTDSGDNALIHITQTAGEALEELTRKQSAIQDNLARVVTMGDQLQKLQQMSDELRIIARFLKMVGINISIESSRSEDAEEIFVALAKEIRDLAVTVNRVTRLFSSDLYRVQTELTAMHQQMCAKLDHFQQLAATVKKSIEHAAPSVQAIISRSVEALAQVGEDAQAISQSVADIVMSLQIHDNVSQRVEHIVEALADVKQGTGAQPSDDGHIDAGNPELTALDANLVLQIAQLEQIVRDIEEAYRVGTQAFEKISRTIENIAQNMTLIGDDQSSAVADGTASSSSFEALKKALEEINAMIGRGNDTVNELQGITQSATTAVTRIEEHMDHVREVNFDIYLKSLNAMFKSIRLGSKGKAIEALVQGDESGGQPVRHICRPGGRHQRHHPGSGQCVAGSIRFSR